VAKGPTIAAWIAVAWCAVISLVFLVAPAYTSESVSAGPGGPIRTQSTSTLVEHEGAQMLLVLAFPLFVTVAAALLARTRIARVVLVVSSAVLWLAIFVTGFSVGLLYLPAGLAMLAALVMAFSQTPIRGDHPNLG
jgi:hypothetical protein